MFDIAQQLFPNPVTVIVQLCATFVLYLLYKKHLHQPILDILDKRAAAYSEENEAVLSLREQKLALEKELAQAKTKQLEEITQHKAVLLRELETERQALLSEAHEEAKGILARAQRDIEQQRQAMMASLEANVVELSTTMVEKVLEGYAFDEKQLLLNLEKEIQKHAQS